MSENSENGNKVSGVIRRCSYTDSYQDMDRNNKETFFHCEETAKDSGYCMFHDPEYYRNKPIEVASSIQNKISEHLEQVKRDGQRRPLLLIGYNIPYLSGDRKNFISTVYFTNSKFYGTANFSGVSFRKVDFSKVKFHERAFFNKTKFHWKVIFTLCIFSGEVQFSQSSFKTCKFYRTTFSNKVSFKNARFLGREKYGDETYFGYSAFVNDSEVEFVGIDFGTIVTFENAIFAKTVILENVKFHKGINFSGSSSDQFGSIFFRKVVCWKIAIFHRATFKGAVHFQNSTFHNADFSNCSFQNTTNFYGYVDAKDKSRYNDGKTRFNGATSFSYCNFDGAVLYNRVDFHRNVKFDGSQFTPRSLVYFHSVRFLSDDKDSGMFPYAKFQGNVFFEFAEFRNDAQFNNIETTETSILTFRDSTFKKRADFSGCVLHDNVFFIDHTTFEAEANFDASSFHKQITFEDCKFASDLTFKDTIFAGGLSFKCIQFENKEKMLSFEGAHFSENADFSNIEFRIQANFKNIIFDGNSFANFSRNEFKEKVDFSECHIMENSIISFKDVCFSNKMLFQYAIIDNEIRLDHSLFRDVADFSHADFQDIRINNVIFNNRNSEKITFRGAHFAKSLLEEVEFNAAVSFEQAFFEIATFVKTKFNVGADFNFVTFKSGDDVLFDIEDLSKISFLNTDISRVHFHEDAVWGTPAFRFKILEEYNLDKAFEYAKRIQSLINNNNLTADKYHNFKVGDEIPSDEIPNSELRVVEIKGNNKVIKVKDSTDKEFTYILERHFDEINVHPKMSVGGIRSLYRALRENYDYWLRHEEANQVYWREMEIQRIYREIAPRPKKKKSTDEDEIKSKKNAWIRRNFSSTGLYRRVSDYGMSYLKPIFIAALAIAFPVAWEVYGSYEATLHPVASDANLTAVQNETATTRQNQTAEKIEEVAAKRLADTLGIESDELVGYFARAIAFSVVGVLAISAIKNKFERKSRK